MLIKRRYLPGVRLRKILSTPTSNPTFSSQHRWSDLSAHLLLVDPNQYNEDSGTICGTHEFAFPTISELIQWDHDEDLGRQLAIRSMFIFIDYNDVPNPRALACRAKYFNNESEYLNIRFKQATSSENNGNDLIWGDVPDQKKYNWIQLGMDVKSIFTIIRLVRGDHLDRISRNISLLYETYDMLQFNVSFPKRLNIIKDRNENGLATARKLFNLLVTQETLPNGFAIRSHSERQDYAKLVDDAIQQLVKTWKFVTPLSWKILIEPTQILTHSLKFGLPGSDESMHSIRKFIMDRLLSENHSTHQDSDNEKRGHIDADSKLPNLKSIFYQGGFGMEHGEFGKIIFAHSMNLIFETIRCSYDVNQPRKQKLDLLWLCFRYLNSRSLNSETLENAVIPCVAKIIGNESLVLKNGDDAVIDLGIKFFNDSRSMLPDLSRPAIKKFFKISRISRSLSDAERQRARIHSFEAIVQSQSVSASRLVGEILYAISGLELTSRPDLPDKDSIINLLKSLISFDDRGITRSVAKTLKRLSLISRGQNVEFMDRSEVEEVIDGIDGMATIRHQP